MTLWLEKRWLLRELTGWKGSGSMFQILCPSRGSDPGVGVGVGSCCKGKEAPVGERQGKYEIVQE